MGNINLIVYTAVSLLCLHVTHSQLDPEDVEKINSFMTELMDCRQMPGAAIALLKVSIVHYIKTINTS